jgi:hypothetical protein
MFDIAFINDQKTKITRTYKDKILKCKMLNEMKFILSTKNIGLKKVKDELN